MIPIGARVTYTDTGATGKVLAHARNPPWLLVRFDDTGEEIWCLAPDLTEETTFS